MTRMVLHLCLIITMAICNLHSPSMLHAQEAEHSHHLEAADADHDALVSEQTDDMDRGTLAHDHHAPTAMTVASPNVDMPLGYASGSYRLSNADALNSWTTAPPPEPPAA